MWAVNRSVQNAFKRKRTIHQADARSLKRERANSSYRLAITVLDFV
jgi:hypothetical protein